jgi:hypothetical protein
MRQYVTLSGMGQEKFNSTIKSIVAIHDFFRLKLKEGAMAPWTPVSYQGYPALTFSCRYMSRKGDGPIVELNEEVDPRGLLSHASHDLIHTAMNNVGYYERQAIEAVENGQ